jgi:hypothetical protein
MRSGARRWLVAWALVALSLVGCESSSATLGRPDGGGIGDWRPEGGTNRDGLPTGDAAKVDTTSPAAESGVTAPDAPGAAAETIAGSGDLVADNDAPATGADALSPTPGLDGAIDSPQLVSSDAGLVCGQAGAACRSAGDCCGLACLAGRCSAGACLSDGETCASGGECCSTVCGSAGTCVALNPTCKTAGNACTTDAECCNRTCNANHQCASPAEVSFCAQVGDLCRGDAECCTGVCLLADGGVAGTCGGINTTCKIDGTLCNGCGECCSHFCGPYGAAGPSICQPASGCHVQGDLCRKDSDCCGGDIRAGLPGAGLIRCEPDPLYGSRIGTCGNPSASNCPSGSPNCKNACNPEGNVCHYKETLVCAGSLTNVRNDCCQCVSSKGCCQPDATGIPRCNSLAACVPTGGDCSFSGECCNHEPCLPDPTTGQLVCGSKCVEAGGACTTNADCCTGMLCHTTAGSVAGICMIPPPPVVVPDGGSPSDAAGAPDVPPVCAFWGQACSPEVPCCGVVPCQTTSGYPCTAAGLDCVCYSWD